MIPETETGVDNAMLTMPLTVPIGIVEQRVQEADRLGPHDAGSPSCEVRRGKG